MTKDETASAIALIKSSHKSYFEKMSHQDKLELRETWHTALKDYDYGNVCNAINDCLKASKFVPKLAEVIDRLNAGIRYRTVHVGCDICDNTGIIAYEKPYDYGGKVGMLSVKYYCRCSCNANGESKIPTYREVFGFDPAKKSQPSSTEINISQLRREFQKWVDANTKK